MLVEDDKSLREIYGVRLLAEGYDIISAGDGEEALAMAIKDRPELIVSDVMMPKISGFDMLDILRSTTETKNIKVIMMTALSSEEQRQRGEQLGADKYLVKSQVGIEDVVKAVHEVLGDRPNSGAPSSTLNPPRTAATSPPPASADSPASPPNASGIPQPTAPFSGQRPATLGDRVIQPLKDNPRVSNVNVGELLDKEFASSIQSVENTTLPGEPGAGAGGISSSAPSSSSQPPTVSMDPPSAPQPAPDDPLALSSAAPSDPGTSAQPTATSSLPPAVPPLPASPAEPATDSTGERGAASLTPPERPN